jgi:hypothetical protein
MEHGGSLWCFGVRPFGGYMVGNDRGRLAPIWSPFRDKLLEISERLSQPQSH